MAREERLEAQLLEGRRELRGASEQLVESLEVVRADATPVKVKKETAGARSQPPPLISGSEALSPGDTETPHCQEDQGEQTKRESLQFVHTLHNLSPWHLPPLPEFSGDDQTSVNNSFQQ